MWGVAGYVARAVFSRRFWASWLPLEALRAWWAMRGRGWRLGPDAEYLAFRMVTAYGSADNGFRPEDLNEYLAWRRRHRQARR